jgi:hypothetical protein
MALRVLDYDRRLRMGVQSSRAQPVGRHEEGRARWAFVAIANSSIALDMAVLGALTCAIAAVYLWTKAPLYNSVGTIDPWLYTALWTNFDQIYTSFFLTYYVSRLPWIVPGYVLNGILDAQAASLVLHSVFFIAGGVLFYVLIRRWLGVLAGALGYVALTGSQMYFNAHRWDYQEGGVLTFMIAAYAFSLPRTRSPWLRATSLLLGGFFAAAMVTTRVLDVVYLVGLPLLYLAVAGDLRTDGRLNQFARDLAAFAVGAVTLLAGGILFAHMKGGEDLFFMSQIRVVRSTSGGYNQLPVDQWLPFAPYFWVPLFVLLFAVAVLALGPREGLVARRVLLASTLWLALDFVPFTMWQFLGSGWLFNLAYYFSSFLIPTLFCLAAATAVLVGVRAGLLLSLCVGAACAVAVLGPVVWIYRSDSSLRVASGYRDDSYVATFAAMAVALLLVAIARIPAVRIAAAAAVAAAFFAAAYGVASSYATLAFGVSDQRTGGLYDVGQQLIDHLRANGYRDKLPLFWFDMTEQGGAVMSIQSLYFYGYTHVDSSMPTIGETFRARFDVFESDRLVLLCGEPRCQGGPAALERAGYRPRLRFQTLLESAGFRLWVRDYEVAAPERAGG